jgi:hypothetical protein
MLPSRAVFARIGIAEEKIPDRDNLGSPMSTRRYNWFGLFVWLFTWTSAAHAQDGTVLSTARELAKQGLAAFDAARYEESAKKLSQAYDIVHMPTLAVFEARALAKLGKLVEASELYLEATRLQRTDSWQAAQYQAQIDAERERIELLPRIPRLTIQIQGTNAGGVSVSVNGADLPKAMIGVEALVNPGELRVVGKRGDEVVKETASLQEGGHGEVTLRFGQPSPAAITPPKTNSPVSKVTPPKVTQFDNRSNQEPRRDNLRLLGWVGVGVGSTGIALGAVSGLVAMSKKPSGCEGLHCPVSEDGSVNSYNRLLNVSTVGFVVGGVAAAAGATLLLVSPKQASQPRVGLWLNPDSAGIYGGF